MCPIHHRVSQRCTASYLVFFAILLLCVWAIAPVSETSAHATLVRADPPADGLLIAPPDQLSLWFSEPVDASSPGPALTLLDEAGRVIELGAASLDTEDDRLVFAGVPALGPGTYTVSWAVRSATDGHALAGTYAFRLGGGRAPGAATIEGESPQVWAVVTRWLTFLGIALAAGGGFFRLVVAPGSMGPDRLRRRSDWAIAVGAGVALLATLAEPPLQTLVSPPGGIAPSLDEAMRGLPDAWWLRPAALVSLLMVMIGVVLGWRRWPRATGALLPLGLGLVALLGLSLTSHAAARESLRGPALLSNILHQWSVALWAGGLVHLALNWSTSGETPPVRRFSRVALPLVAVGVLTGVANAGLVLPAVSALWGSTYGVALLLKVALLVVPLVLATFNRVALRRMAGAVGASLRRSVRLELAVVVLVALGGSTLALLAPPEGKAGDVTAIELVSPLLSAAPNPDDEMLAHLRIDPAAEGDNALRFWLTSSDGAALPIGELERVRLDFTSLDHAVRPVVAAMEPEGNGLFQTGGLALSLTGWWRIDAGATVPDGSTMTATFYLILPDPNVHGFAEPPIPSASDEGQAVFERGLAALGALSSARWSERIGDGLGHLAQADYALREAAGDDVAAMSITAGQTAVVRIGERAWLRRETTGWLEQPGTEIIDFETLAETYAHAVAFRLGVVEEIDGEPAQIVTFYLPETERSAPAWFAWWVGVESGQLVRETMVARSHYMVHEYRALNEPLELEPPPLE